ncbi:MAG TPA: rod shape-determining protein MreC [Burkholderiales bacterium]|jgi:rod shape-determining protein MreC|nr:rod shape-determining protein MreC [Burkholderiales bacterium]
MEYSPPPFFKRGPNLVTRLTLFSLLSLVLLFADARFQYMDDIRGVVGVILYPFQEIVHTPARIGRGMMNYVSLQSTLRTENTRLREEAFVNAGLLQKQQALVAENENLRELLNLRPRFEPSSQVASILFAARDPFVRQVVVDKGATDGVMRGAPVIDTLGLIGQVHRVYPWASEVALITDREQVVPVQVVRNGLRAVIFGLGYDGALEVRFMPVNADIEKGDLLVTSGIDGLYPSGLPVAFVDSVERNAAYPFARITCRPASGVGSHSHVMVLGSTESYPERPIAPDQAETDRRERN